MTDLPSPPGDFRYPTPTASPFVDWRQYIPLLLSAVEAELDIPGAFSDEDEDTALGYIEDLKAWLMELEMTTPTPTGTINLYAGSTAPTGWLFCQGQALTISEYEDLYAVIGGTYNGGLTLPDTFLLPDLRGRTAIGAGTGGGLTARTLGQTVGTETHALTVAQMPEHSHGVRGRFGGTSAGSSNRFLQSTNGTIDDTRTTDNAGSGQAHNNMQPSLVLNYIIKT